MKRDTAANGQTGVIMDYDYSLINSEQLQL